MMRPFTCAAVVAGGLLLVGVGAPDASADPDGRGHGDSSDSRKGGADDRRSGSAGSRRGSDHDDTAARRSESQQEQSLSIPVMRLPSSESERSSDGCSGSACRTTVAVQVPSIDGAVTRLQPEPVPEPEPVPGPAFRGGGEDEPVLEASGIDTGGGSSYTADDSFELDVPLAIAPPPATMQVVISAPPPSATPLGVAQQALGLGAQMGSAPPPSSTPPLPSNSLLSNPAARFGLEPFRRPTGGAFEMIGTLPGLIGLLLVTISSGFIGYRQANAGRYVPAVGADRFLQ